MFYKGFPCEWCDRNHPFTLLVETPDFNAGKKIEQYSYLCVECINETHDEVQQHTGKSNVIPMRRK